MPQATPEGPPVPEAAIRVAEFLQDKADALYPSDVNALLQFYFEARDLASKYHDLDPFHYLAPTSKQIALEDFSGLLDLVR